MAMTAVATLIGDLVDSRTVSDRSALQRKLQATLARLAEGDGPYEWKQRPAPTVGDEFQAVLPDLESAVSASLRIRLELIQETGVDSRFGIGWGEIEMFDEARSPASQDGPGWWAAREAIDEASSMAETQRSAFIRTRVAGSGTGGEIDAMNAYLAMRDATIDAMKPAALRYLLGSIRGEPQSKIAQREGVTQHNVSQVLSRSGPRAILLAERELSA